MSEIKLTIDHTPITLDNFFVDHHYANKENVYDESKETVLNEALAYNSPEKIQAIEAKFEIVFPHKLTEIYLKQNGGPVGSLTAPKVEYPHDDVEEDWVFPFSGYDDLYRLEDIRTVYDSVEDYAGYPEDIEMFPKNSKRLIILAQWYRHTLFLDYRNSREPKLGFVDFDRFEDLQKDDWEKGAMWWKDFDTFFSQLLRGGFE